MIHAVFDVTGCQSVGVPAERIMTAMRDTVTRLGCTVRAQVIEPFQPHGATCIVVLAESHMTVSTWPEHRLAHIDLFTCRADIDPEDAVVPILDVLGGQIARSQTVHRIVPGESASDFRA